MGNGHSRHPVLPLGERICHAGILFCTGHGPHSRGWPGCRYMGSAETGGQGAQYPVHPLRGSSIAPLSPCGIHNCKSCYCITVCCIPGIKTCMPCIAHCPGHNRRNWRNIPRGTCLRPMHIAGLDRSRKGMCDSRAAETFRWLQAAMQVMAVAGHTSFRVRPWRAKPLPTL